jgi:MFS family permease
VKDSMTSVLDAAPTAAPMSHRRVLEAMLGLFVTVLSSTGVSTSLPRIIADLGGGQTAFTWVVTATLLAMTASTPVWGKLADLAVVASAAVGVGMFGTTVFLSQYLQLGRGQSPTASGLLTMPMVAGVLVSSIVVAGSSPGPVGTSGGWCWAASC